MPKTKTWVFYATLTLELVAVILFAVTHLSGGGSNGNEFIPLAEPGVLLFAIVFLAYPLSQAICIFGLLLYGVAVIADTIYQDHRSRRAAR